MKKVVLIESNVILREIIMETLELSGYKVFTSENGKKGIEMVNLEKPDVILCATTMPEMDGYEAIPLIKAIPSQENTFVVAVTAQAMTGDREKCLEAGADAYISKPVDVDKLLQILGEI